MSDSKRQDTQGLTLVRSEGLLATWDIAPACIEPGARYSQPPWTSNALLPAPRVTSSSRP